jgi:hypothetical protein
LASQGLACIKDLKRDIKDLINPYFDEKKSNMDKINKNYFLNVRKKY